MGERRGGDTTKSKAPKLAECKGKETRDIAAQKAGFKHSTYANAKKVVDQGESELVDAMDAGKIKPSVAADLVELSPAEQIRLAL